jgi:rubrerythrin
MSSLFNISQDFKSLYILANDAENEDMEALAELFSEVETSLSDKLDNTIYVIKELDSDAEALKAEAKALD